MDAYSKGNILKFTDPENDAPSSGCCEAAKREQYPLWVPDLRTHIMRTNKVLCQIV